MRSKYIERSNIEKLSHYLGSSEWLPLRLSLETGLRIGDVLSLKCGDVWERMCGLPYINATASKTGKTGMFPISHNTFKILRNIAPADTDRYLFPSYGKTGHLTRQAAWARMKRAARSCGIDPDGISPHSLRKCFAVSLMHNEGIEAVKHALQHSNLAVTRVYAYADTILNFDSDAPIRWRDVEMIVDYILERLSEKTKKSLDNDLPE